MQQRIVGASALLAALMSVVNPVHADDELFFSELPVVATVSRLPQRLADAATAVTVIDREMIRASGARALNDVLRLVPGFQTYPHNTDPARVTYHGISDEDYSPRVQVLIDGRSLHSPLFRSGVNWALMPVALEDIERIEVVRGSNTTSFGTNAFLGVINIITVDPSLVRGFSLAVNHGNQGVRDYTLRTGGQLGENGNIRLTYQQLDDNGLEDQYDWVDGFRSRLLDIRADFQLSGRDNLEVQAGKIEGAMVLGRLDKKFVDAQGKLYLSLPSNPIRDLDMSSSWLQLRWLRALDENADFSLRFSYAADTASDAFVYKGQRYDEYGDRGHRSEIEAVHHFSPTEQTRVAWGASWRQDTLHAKYRLGPDKVVRDVGRVFANAEWKPLAWLTANLGASSEYDTLAGNNVSPRGSLNFHLTPDNTIRLGYANAWRTGGILDYRANPLTGWAGNRDLPSERLDSWEIGYLGDWKSWRMSLDVRRYQEKIGNRSFKIKPINTYDSIEPIQDIRIDGIEYQWKWQPLDNTRLVVAQTFTSIGSDYTPEALADPRTNILVAPGRKVLIEELAQESAPRRMSSLLWIQKLPAGFEASLARYWVDPMKWTRSTFVKTYVRTDARLAYGFRLGGQRGEIAYTVQSLDGAHGEFKYEGDQPADRVVDRRHWVSLRLDF